MSGGRSSDDRDESGATGTLVLVATPIGNLGDLSPRAAEVLRMADIVCCEDTRHTGVLLHTAGITAHRLVSLHAHNEAARLAELLEAFAAAKTVALVSDAGTPLVSDPGERLVRAAIAAGVTISAVPGPSAGLMALVLSGFDLSRWRFEGFLPRKGAERRARLEEIAAARHPSVVYEAPGRVEATLGDLELVTGPARTVTVARELTKRFEELWRGPIADALEHVRSREPRGEYVLVVEGASSGVDETHDIDEDLRALFAAGLNSHDAVAALEVLRGVRHREAYGRALALRAEVRDGS